MPGFAVALPSPPVRRLRPSRVQFGLLIGVVVSLWFVLAFGRTMADLSDANGRAAAVRADNAELTLRLAQAQREAALLQSTAYLRFAARGFGMGGPGEQAFGLEPGAPSPAPMVPLGQTAPAPAPATALDGWLSLLFGD
jgi:cell division protein FtsB